MHAAFDDLDGNSAHAKAGEILHGLGFSDQELQTPYAEFSGGWRIRLHLAQALMSPCDLLLLDEPTNHLDLEAIMWLQHSTTWNMAATKGVFSPPVKLRKPQTPALCSRMQTGTARVKSLWLMEQVEPWECL